MGDSRDGALVVAIAFECFVGFAGLEFSMEAGLGEGFRLTFGLDSDLKDKRELNNKFHLHTSTCRTN